MSQLDGLSVLFVEDEFLIALEGEQILNDLGAAKVEVVGTFDKAMARAQEGAFDLAVLDININGTRSYPIAKVLAKRGIPFVFASGYEMRDQPLSDLESAIFIRKPYAPEHVKAALLAALAASGGNRSA